VTQTHQPTTQSSNDPTHFQFLDRSTRYGLARMPLYTDEEAQLFARRAEQLAADILAKKRERPNSLQETLAILGIDERRLGYPYTNVGNATNWIVYSISEHYRMTVVVRLTGGDGFLDGLAIMRKDD
jgi:hypothetical protein